MPSIVVGPFKIFVFTDDHHPAHVHVRVEGAELRVYLAVDRASELVYGRMAVAVRRRAERAVFEHRRELMALWERFHGK